MNDATVSPDRIDALVARVRREVDDGVLPACQIAVARHGEIIVDATFGAPEETRFIPYSATKVLPVAAIWRLIGDAGLDVSRTVASYLPSFGANGKDRVTVEQVMLHTGGFPMAPLGPRQWRTHESRLAEYEQWTLEFPPGERYVYHPVSAQWVLADIIESVTGTDYREAIHSLVTEPLGLPRLLGIPLDAQGGIAEVVGVGERPSIDELAAEFGEQVRDAPQIPVELVLFALTSLNHPKAKAQGVPGGGAVVRAADMALLYQGLLNNPGGIWDADVLADGTGHVRSMLPDDSGVPASRTLGIVVAGDDGLGSLRGFGTTNSTRAFGHNGAGGQLAFADPATGISACYVTNGLDQNLIREHRRNVEIADAVSALVPSAHGPA